MANTRAQTLSEIIANIFQNSSKAITGTIMQTVLVDMANSYANLETDVVGLNNFSATKQYVIGNTVVYSGVIYQANTSHLGAWNASHFDVIGGGGTPTIQDVYDASTFPFVTDDVIGGFIIQNGQSTDSEMVFEIQDISGTPSFTVYGDGDIVNGNWQATAIAAAFGGTGQTSYTTGDILYASNSTTLSKLNIGTSGQVLTISGGVPVWGTFSASNIGISDLTITDNGRYLRLKTGYSSSQFFQIQNTGGENFIKWIGDGTAQARGQYFFNAAVNGGQELYVIRAKSHGGFEKFRVQAEDNQGIVDIWGNQSYQLISLNSTGTSYFYNSLAIGSATASARLDVKGSGSTSATLTALFQNSSSVAALTIKDDLSSLFGGDVTISKNASFSSTTNSSLTGANARIASHPSTSVVFTNASLTSIGSAVAGVTDGHVLFIINETGASITIVDNYGSAAAGEVIYTNTASNYTLRNHCGASFQYNLSGACWSKV